MNPEKLIDNVHSQSIQSAFTVIANTIMVQSEKGIKEARLDTYRLKERSIEIRSSSGVSTYHHFVDLYKKYKKEIDAILIGLGYSIKPRGFYITWYNPTIIQDDNIPINLSEYAFLSANKMFKRAEKAKDKNREKYTHEIKNIILSEIQKSILCKKRSAVFSFPTHRKYRFLDMNTLRDGESVRLINKGVPNLEDRLIYMLLKKDTNTLTKSEKAKVDNIVDINDYEKFYAYSNEIAEEFEKDGYKVVLHPRTKLLFGLCSELADIKITWKK